MTKEEWVAELKYILVTEHGATENNAQAYAEIAYPTEDEVIEIFGGEVPTPREALAVDIEYWDAD